MQPTQEGAVGSGRGGARALATHVGGLTCMSLCPGGHLLWLVVALLLVTWYSREPFLSLGTEIMVT